MKIILKSPQALTKYIALLMSFLSVICTGEDGGSLAITHAVIIDGNGKIPIEDGTIVIRGAKKLKPQD